MPVMGTPSGAAELRDAFGRKKAHVGADGEARTAYVLDRAFRDDPATWVIHDVQAPGYDYANIDHVLLRSTDPDRLRGVIIDSKLWQPGKYRLDKNGAVLRDGKPFSPATKALGLVNMGQALARYLNFPTQGFSLQVAVWPSKVGKIDMGRFCRHLDLGQDVRMVRGGDLVKIVEAELGQRSRGVFTDLTDAVDRIRPLVRGAS